MSAGLVKMRHLSVFVAELANSTEVSLSCPAMLIIEMLTFEGMKDDHKYHKRKLQTSTREKIN